MFARFEELQADWRFEYKYRLTYQEYLQVRSAIHPVMKKDGYTIQAPGQKYLVRSLYFDSDTFNNYLEKINGDCDRVKLRIRTYDSSPISNIPLRVELKARKGITVEKYSTWITYKDYKFFMTKNHWEKFEDATLSEFERYVHLKTQKPKIIVEYLREGYRTRSGNNIRITFDHKVKSAHADSLFPEKPFFRFHHPGRIILEIKCMKSQPLWLRQLIFRHGLRITPNSKYTQGIEVARNDVVIPKWSY